MVIGALQVKLHFPEPQSLKEKRTILKSVLARLRNQFNVSISELEGMDLWQYTMIAAVCVAREKKEAERQLDQVIHFFDKEDKLRVVEHQKELL